MLSNSCYRNPTADISRSRHVISIGAVLNQPSWTVFQNAITLGLLGERITNRQCLSGTGIYQSAGTTP